MCIVLEVMALSTNVQLVMPDCICLHAVLLSRSFNVHIDVHLFDH